MNKISLEIILVDVDRTLCEEVCFNNNQVKKATPIKKNIEKVNYLHDKNFIVIYTARRTHLIEDTIEWLRENGVKYHAISNVKIPGKYYIDEDNLKFENFKKY